MSVLLNTSAGDIVIDLYAEQCPVAARNFVKLCQLKYYNNCLFYNVQQNFIAQTGDPTGTGKGGSSAYGIANGESFVYFDDEIVKNRKINKVGMVGMAHSGGKENSNRSQFFITLRGEDMEQFENTHTMFGEIAEGLDVLEKINGLYCDDEGRPYQDVRILHTYILDDPFPDLPNLQIPPSSPERSFPLEERVRRRITYSETIEDDADGKTAEELDQSIRRKEAKSRAIVLEMTGDLPDAEVKPPEEVIFVCKLNPVTTDEDLELIFSRFGTIKSCEVIRDFKTGESLNYAFIEFETAAACIEAYEKMNNVLIDDRRIKVDFSQSVSKLWNRFLLQPRKDESGGSAKPNEKPSYYMKQSAGMDLASRPVTSQSSHAPPAQGHTASSDRRVEPQRDSDRRGPGSRSEAAPAREVRREERREDRHEDRRPSRFDRDGKVDGDRRHTEHKDRQSGRRDDSRDRKNVRERSKERTDDRNSDGNSRRARESPLRRRQDSRDRGRDERGYSHRDEDRTHRKDRERSRSRDRGPSRKH